MNKRFAVMVLAGAVMAAAGGAGTAWGQADKAGGTAPATDYKLLPNSESQFAHELLRLGQVDSIKAMESDAKGTPAENLWKAQEIVATWKTIAANRIEMNKATAAYLAAMKAYLDATPEGIDGVWALDHAKFVLGSFSSAIIDRMEYWSNNPKDRAALAPRAELADRLLKQAAMSFDAAMKAAYAPGHAPDDNAYMRAYSANGEAEYYIATGEYFKAMSMEPGVKERKDLLMAAATALGKWADDDNDNYVNKQALLLRGKARSEAGELDKAVEDLNKAEVDGPGTIKAPDWVKYQARYQVIVTRIRAGDYSSAYKELDAFKQTLPKGDTVAEMSTNMLGYRIAWAEASHMDGKARQDAQIKALGILAGIIKTDPRFRDLIYEQLAAQIPDGADVKTLLPMQQLAIAYTKSSGQKGDTPESRQQLQAAINAALEVRKNPASGPSEKLEATFLAGVCSAVIGQLQDAVKYNVEFVATAPDDPRSKKLLADEVMPQIGKLKELSRKTGSPLTPEMNKTIEEALALSAGKFHDPRFLYAQGRTLEEDGKLLEAQRAYTQIPEEDKNYIDARYRLVVIATSRISELTKAKASPSEVGAAADDLFKACSKFVALLDNPPKGTPKDLLDRVRSYRTDILMIEASTALNPMVKRPEVAVDRLQKLDKVKSTMTELQKGAILRYWIQAYQMNGQVDKIMPLLRASAKETGQNPIEVFRGLAVSTVEDINKAEQTDPEQAKRLADFVVKLFDPIIDQEVKDGQNATDDKSREQHKKNVFDLKQIKADMMVRAGDYDGAKALCEELIASDGGKDIRSFMTEARASWVKADATKNPKDYAYAQDYLGRVVARITPGADAWWECWLRILQCKEAQGGPGVASEIKGKLNDLKAISGKFGGDQFKDEFAALAAKYGAN